MMEWVIGILCLTGAFFALVAGVGVLRLPDVLIRMHASTKAGTLGSGLILAAVALSFWNLQVTTKVIVGVVFLLLTAPIAAHMIGRAALKIGVDLWQTPRVPLTPGRPTSKPADE